MKDVEEPKVVDLNPLNLDILGPELLEPGAIDLDVLEPSAVDLELVELKILESPDMKSEGTKPRKSVPQLIEPKIDRQVMDL